MAMEKLNPLLYIHDTDPVDEAVMDASGWFDTEEMVVTLRAMEGGTFATETITWYAAQGWKIVDTKTWEVIY